MKAKEFFKIHKAATILSCVGAGAVVLCAVPIITNEVLRDKTDYDNEYHIPERLAVSRTNYKAIIDPNTQLPMDILIPLVAPKTNEACWDCLTTQRFLEEKWDITFDDDEFPIWLKLAPDWNVDWLIWDHTIRVQFGQTTPPVPFHFEFGITISWYDILTTQTSILPETTFNFN